MSEQNLGEAPTPTPREPNVHSGGQQEHGGPLPPYEGHQTTGKSDEELQEERGGSGSMTGPREVSQAEREGVSATDTTGASPLGVGESTTTQGEELMHGKPEAAHREDQVSTGVGGFPESADPDSPTAIVGDQGG